MKDRVRRRGFLKVAGGSPGFGALYRVAPLPDADGAMKLTVVVE